MAFTLPPLPWAKDALAPHISAETIEFHYGKHHQTYVDNLNKADRRQARGEQEPRGDHPRRSRGPAVQQRGPGLEPHLLLELDEARRRRQAHRQAARGDQPRLRLGCDNLLQQFGEAAKTQFGSGWAWLVEEGGKLKVTKTANADLPMKHKQKALLTMRRLGARLLHRLPQRAPQVRRRVPGEPRQLGLRREEPGVATSGGSRPRTPALTPTLSRSAGEGEQSARSAACLPSGGRTHSSDQPYRVPSPH